MVVHHLLLLRFFLQFKIDVVAEIAFQLFVREVYISFPFQKYYFFLEIFQLESKLQVLFSFNMKSIESPVVGNSILLFIIIFIPFIVHVALISRNKKFSITFRTSKLKELFGERFIGGPSGLIIKVIRPVRPKSHMEIGCFIRCSHLVFLVFSNNPFVHWSFKVIAKSF